MSQWQASLSAQSVARIFRAFREVVAEIGAVAYVASGRTAPAHHAAGPT